MEKRKHMEKLLMPIFIHFPLLCPRSVCPEHALPQVLPLQAEEGETGRDQEQDAKQKSKGKQHAIYAVNMLSNAEDLRIKLPEIKTSTKAVNVD